MGLYHGKRHAYVNFNPPEFYTTGVRIYISLTGTGFVSLHTYSHALQFHKQQDFQYTLIYIQVAYILQKDFLGGGGIPDTIIYSQVLSTV